ncbi:unnamed protein product [Porites lobata]|uniref:Uncharacterized protein n=1 Tax=Porites lobata TaxID=104759 RepID=A0ABN8QFQ8_9CNID|nr:unnamed protein product [Porites lobata]
MEKYISFSLGGLQFIDSLNFLQASLDSLILEADLEYPAKLHRAYNGYPLAPEKKKIKREWMSAYQKTQKELSRALQKSVVLSQSGDETQEGSQGVARLCSGYKLFDGSDAFPVALLFLAVMVFVKTTVFMTMVHAVGCCDDNLVLHSSFNWFQPVSVLFTIVLTMEANAHYLGGAPYGAVTIGL